MALKPPVEVPQGAIRLNTDSQKLEFFAQDQWWQMATTEAPPIGGRMIIQQGGYSPAQKITYVNISTKGNAIDFGTTTKDYYESSAVGSKTRCVFAGGSLAGGHDNIMEYITIASQGNAVDFGDEVEGSQNPTGGSGDNTRGILCGGVSSNMISYFTISSTGNAIDFGADQPFTGTYSCAVNSTTRSVMAGGRVSPYTAQNAMWYITIQSTGIVNDFGDQSVTQGCFNRSSCDSSTRGILAGGREGTHPSGGNTNIMEYITIATTGNGIEFGDLTAATQMSGGSSNCTRGVFTHGSDTTGIDTMEIATLGNAVEFGDNLYSTSTGCSTSNAHGGLV